MVAAEPLPTPVLELTQRQQMRLDLIKLYIPTFVDVQRIRESVVLLEQFIDEAATP